MNNSISFSTQNRKTVITKMEQELFDVIVIGGGITGSGIALDAISRGLNVALIERKDFASGTSSRSGKLIHGGLKYLQNFDFPVVKETGSEREIVYNNALHLVYPIKMNFPLIKNESYNLLTLKAGLTLYDRLAGVKKEERHRIYGKKKTLQNEPLFNPNTVKGSGVYVEYRTDDSRLTMEVAKTAAEKGAQVLNYAEMTEFLKNEENIVKGIVVKDHIENKTFTIYGKHIVNAAGPWVDVVRKKDRPVTGKYMVLAKGIHIVFDRKSLPVNSSIYFQHKGRMIAVIPIGNRTYVGSTESTYKEDMDDIHVNLAEVHYLLGCLKDMFPNLTLSVSDVISSWAGIRPLIGQEGKSPAELSRHDEIFESDTGLITIAGGKLTGYRKMAERVMQYIEKKEKKNVTPSKTDTIKLSGSQFYNQQELESYAEKLTGYYHDIQLDKEDILNLVYRYGSNTELVLQSISSYKQLENREDMAILGELKYTVEHEMVTSLVDFYDRRTSYLLFEPQKITSSLDLVSDELAKLLNWTPEKKQEGKSQLYYAISKTLSFK